VIFVKNIKHVFLNAFRAEALKIIRPYQRNTKIKNPAQRCPICRQYRSKLSDHLRRAHDVTKTSLEIKNQGKYNCQIGLHHLC
jgi:hypothetical protein